MRIKKVNGILRMLTSTVPNVVLVSIFPWKCETLQGEILRCAQNDNNC